MPSDSVPAGPQAFTQAMGTAMGQAKSAADEFSRMFSELKMPPMIGTEALLTAHKRNMDTITAANRVAMEGAQAVAKRHVEIMQQTMAEISETMRSLGSPESPQERATKQADMLKQAYERAVANTKELSDLIQHSNGEALGLLNGRFVEAMGEVKSLMAKSALEAPKPE